MHICSPRQIFSLLILYCWHLLRAAVHDSWPPLYFHSTLYCPFCLSSQRPSENSNKRPQLRVGWEWTAQRQTNLSLLCICWPQHSCCFPSRSHFTQTPLVSFFLSNKHFCFSYTSLWLQIVFHLPWWDCAKDSSTCVKRCKENNSLWAFSALTFCQFWARQPGSKTCCRALLKGQFHRTIAHITPNPSDTQGDPWVTMTKSDRLWIMKANADAKSANWQ